MLHGYDVLVVALTVIPALLAVTVHEIAHGWVALQMGDTTAADAGRLSLNPLRHVDPVGTLIVPATIFVLGEMVIGAPLFFGWARPVPVDWGRLLPVRPGIALVAAAGPGANLLMMAAWAVAGLCLAHADARYGALIYMCEKGIMFNAAIMIINLIPVPPLDGSRIVTALLPAPWAARYNRLEVYGLLIVVAMLLTGVLQRLVGPLLYGVADLIGALGI